jgi:hypothetical protein
MHLPQNFAGLMVRNEGATSGAGIGHHAGLLGLQGNAAMHHLGGGILPSMTNNRGGVSSFLLNQAGGTTGGQSLFSHGSGGDMLSYNLLSPPPSDGEILAFLPAGGLDLRQTSLLLQQGEQRQQLLGRRSNPTAGKDFSAGERQSDELEMLRKVIKISRNF